MATAKSLLSNVSVGRFTLLALVLGLVAGLSALLAGHSPLAAFTAAELVAALVLGAVAGLHQFAKTGSVPGPLLSGGTVLMLLVNAAITVFPQAVSTPQTQVGFAALALAFLVVFEEELMGLPVSIPGFSRPSGSVNTTASTTTSTSSVGAVTSTGPGVTSTVDALDSLVNDLGTPPKP